MDADNYYQCLLWSSHISPLAMNMIQWQWHWDKYLQSAVLCLKAETTEYLYHLLESAVWILYVGRHRYDIIHAHLNKMDLMEPSLISKLVGLAQTCLLSLLSLDCLMWNFLWSATRDVFNIRDWYFMCHRGDLIKCYTIYEN